MLKYRAGRSGRWRPIGAASAALTILGGLLLALAATPASAASTLVQPTPGAECQIVLGKVPRPGTPSPILSSRCAAPGKTLAAPLSNVKLMDWYAGTNYGGSHTTVWGSGGPCDSGGYGFSWVGDSWNDRISSYKVFSNCNYSAAWLDINWGGYCSTFYSSVPNVGLLAREVSSMWISSGGFAWNLCEG